MAVAALLERAEAQRVQDGDRSGAHRKDVPKDAAHAGRRPLVGLNRRRVIVGFDLEHHRQPIADVDRAGVLAGPLQHVGTFGGQLAEQRLRGLVGTMLAPQRAEHPQLQLARIATQGRNDRLVLVRTERHGRQREPVNHGRH